jgi:hypothetical protein
MIDLFGEAAQRCGKPFVTNAGSEPLDRRSQRPGR